MSERIRPIERADPHLRRRRMAVLAATVLGAFVILAGSNLNSARQIFDISLIDTIETVESGSAIRQVALVGLAGVSISLLITAVDRRPRFKPIIAVPLGLLLLVVLASAIWAIDPDLTLRRAIAFGLMLVGVAACAVMFDMRRIMFGTVLFTGLFVTGAVLAQLAFGPFTPGVGSWRLAGIVHPVALSWYCGLGAIAAVAVARTESAYRIPARWAAFGFLVCLVLTKTRTGLGATLIGIGVLWLMTSVRKVRSDLPVAAAWIALLVFLVALAFPGDHFSWNEIYTETVETSSFGRTDAIEQIATFTGRLPVWEASLALASQRPLLGFGFSAFQSPEIIPVLSEAAGWVPTSTHSGYIEALLSIGAVGLALVVFVLVASTVESVRMAGRDNRYAFATAVFSWLVVNLAFEAPVLFDPVFSSFLVFLLVAKVAMIRDPNDAAGGS